MKRWLPLSLVLTAVIAASGYGVYTLMFASPTPVAIAPPTLPVMGAVPSPEQFVELAKTDPVRMLAASVTLYKRDVKSFRAWLKKQERIKGDLHAVEELRVVVREEPVAVFMKWREGARPDALGVKTRGVIYPDPGRAGQMLAWRPDAWIGKEMRLDPKGAFPRDASRYCIMDAGFLPTMLRTYRAWEEVQKAGEMRFTYQGVQERPELGGRPCHVIERTCPRRELDSFCMDEAAPIDPKIIERDGFDRVTIMVDAKTWIQVGTELKRTNGDIVGVYYFRDVELNPSLPADQFMAAAFQRSP